MPTTGRHKSAYTLGLETILNNPQTSFLHNPKVFSELHKQSGMSMSEMIRHVGKGARQHKKVPEKTDNEKSQERLEMMEKK